MTRLRVWFPTLVCSAALLAACSGTDDPDAGRLPIDTGVGGQDAAAGRDVGFPDSGPEDTGVVADAGFEDAGPEDTGPLDMGAMDTGVPADSGPEDTGVMADAGSPDAARPDGGGMGDGGMGDGGMGDGGMGDGGPGDAGSPDAGPGDAGSPDAGPGDAGGADAGVTMCNPTFDSMDACGGSIVGTWTYQNACSTAIPFAGNLQGCSAAVVSNVVRSASGTLTLAANGTFTRNLNTITSGDLDLPLSCLPAGVNCALLPAFIPTLIPGASGTCTGGAVCNCSLTVNQTVSDTGGYLTNGGTVTTGVGVDARSYWYCVDPTGALQYRGFPGNVTDNDTTYLLTP